LKLFLDIYKKCIKPFWGTGISKYKLVRTIHHFFSSKLRQESVQLFNNTIYLDKNDDLGLSTIYEEFELPEYRYLEKKIQPNDTVIDVGANIGYYTLIFAKFVGKNGTVYAFEPEPNNFALLKKNIEVNDYHNVILENKAVSNQNGFANLEISNRIGEHKIIPERTKNTIQVQTITLDSIFQSKIDFVKIDTEGYDFKVIDGMKKIIDRFHPKLMIELYPRLMEKAGLSLENSLIKLQSKGYDFFDMETRTKINNKEILIKTTKIKKKTNIMNIFALPQHNNVRVVDK